MMKKTASIILLLALTIGLFFAFPAYARNQIILHVNSYHKGYPPSDGMERGVISVLKNTKHQLMIIRMDTKRNTSESFKKKAGLNVKKQIDRYAPDAVILTDDNAIKYVFVPYFANKDLQFVFSGVNWDLSQYGGPYENLTGMIEVALIDQIIKQLTPYARGSKIGFMSGNNYSERQTAKYAQGYFNIRFSKKYFVSTFAAWQQAWINAQNEVDILIFENNAGIKGWHEKQAVDFIMSNTRIMVGATNDFMSKYAVIGITRDAEEQGEYPAKVALQILDGKKANSFPIVRNKKAHIYLNMKLSKELGIVFPMSLIEDAVFVEEYLSKE